MQMKSTQKKIFKIFQNTKGSKRCGVKNMKDARIVVQQKKSIMQKAFAIDVINENAVIHGSNQYTSGQKTTKNASCVTLQKNSILDSAYVKSVILNT
jgi:hypothetical protein